MMKAAVVLLLALVSSQASRLQQGVTFLSLPGNLAVEDLKVTSVCEGCDRVKITSGSGTPITLSCKDQSTERVYCNVIDNNAVCANTTTTAGCMTVTETFKCPAPGIYPTADNCRNFWVCFDATNVFKAACPAGLTYDALKTQVDDLDSACRSGATCTVFRDAAGNGLCRGKFGAVAHTTNPVFFAFCANTPPTVLKCPIGQRWVENIASCSYSCPTKTKIAKGQCENKYIDCTVDPPKEVECPNKDYVFNDRYQICAPKSTSNCTAPATG